jgi:transposase-like protein
MVMLRKKIDEPEKLDEFLSEVQSYSADFRAMVLKLVTEKQSVAEAAQFAGISEQVIYHWIEEWNAKKKKD